MTAMHPTAGSAGVDPSGAFAAPSARPPRAPDEPRDHPASIAWAMLRPEARPPRAVRRLQEKAKGAVYRLDGAGPMGDAVVAKRSSTARIRHERTFYERILPMLDVRTVEYYGALEAAGADHGWLFVADAGGEPYAPDGAAHRALAGEWLGRLHVSGARLASSALPDRGAAYHLALLRDARELLHRHQGNPALGADDMTVVRAILGQCALVAAHWREIVATCAELPVTIVHGDFAPKNVRVRGAGGDVALVAFDWGSAGLATAAADLVQWSGRTARQWGYWANPDLAAYAATVRGTWPGLELELLERAATVGKLFRCLVCIALSAQSFATPWVERAARNMRIYREEMADGIEAAGWSAGGAS